MIDLRINCLCSMCPAVAPALHCLTHLCLFRSYLLVLELPDIKYFVRKVQASPPFSCSGKVI